MSFSNVNAGGPMAATLRTQTPKAIISIHKISQQQQQLVGFSLDISSIILGPCILCIKASNPPAGNREREREEGRTGVQEIEKLESVMECCKGPIRSDVHLSRDEEAKVEEQTREYFDEMAPKRHSKPQRSEYSSNYVDALSRDDHDNPHPIPELVEFKRLEHNTQKLIYNGSQVEEEFVETAYYKDLNCIDKQHHRTGTGFIKIGNASNKSFSIAPDTSMGLHASCSGNPATNDWIPSAPETVSLPSDKPNRSDN